MWSESHPSAGIGQVYRVVMLVLRDQTGAALPPLRCLSLVTWPAHISPWLVTWADTSVDCELGVKEQGFLHSLLSLPSEVASGLNYCVSYCLYFVSVKWPVHRSCGSEHGAHKSRAAQRMWRSLLHRGHQRCGSPFNRGLTASPHWICNNNSRAKRHQWLGAARGSALGWNKIPILLSQ